MIQNILEILSEQTIRFCDLAQENFYKMAVHYRDNIPKLLEIAKVAFEMGNFKLYISIFERFPQIFYDLGENPFHDNLLNVLIASILLDEEKSVHIFRGLNFQSSWEMKTYDLYKNNLFIFYSILSLKNGDYLQAYSNLFSLTTEVYDDVYFIIDKNTLMILSLLVYVLQGCPEEKTKIVYKIFFYF